MNFQKKLANVLIKNSYMNEKTCGSPSNTRKRKISHILETGPTRDTENPKKGFAQKNISTTNTSIINKTVKIAYAALWVEGIALLG